MIRQTTKALTLAAAMLPAAVAVQAQNVDIGLFQTGSELEVRVRPTEDFTGIVSSVVFTVRWERGTGSRLQEHQQKGAEATYLPIAKSGGVHQDGPFNYQIYAGFGFDQLTDAGVSWRAGQEYVIANIPYAGTGEFALVNDGWTDIDENNGNYYISLNGYDRTGSIYKGMASIASSEQRVTISPNPSRGIFTLTVPVRDGENMSLDILSPTGQVVFQETPSMADGQFRREMDISTYGAGNYLLRITRNGAVENHKIMVQ